MLKRIILFHILLLFLCSHCVARYHVNSNNIVIKGCMPGTHSGDTATLFLWDHLFSEAKKMVTPHRVYKQSCQDGRFQVCALNVEGPVYISLFVGGQPALVNRKLDLYLAMPGDSVTVLLMGGGMSFSGKGASTYTCQYLINKETEKIEELLILHSPKYNAHLNKQLLLYQQISNQEADTLLKEQVSILSRYSSDMNNSAYTIIQGNLIGRSILKKYSTYSWLEKYIKKNNLAIIQDSLYERFHQSVDSSDYKYPPKAVMWSKDYILAKIKQTLADQQYNNANVADLMIARNYSGGLREKLLTSYMVERFDMISDADKMLDRTLETIKEPDFRAVLMSIKNKVSKGAFAYDFTLPDTTGNIVRLGNMKGKIVFIDFWFTGCLGCSQFYKEVLKDVENRFKKDTNIVFVSISIDSDEKMWKESVRKDIYTSPEAINLFTGGEGDLHSVIKQFAVTSYPSFVIVDQAGKIYSNSKLMRERTTLLENIKKLMANNY